MNRQFQDPRFYDKYYILHLTKDGQERLNLSESGIAVWEYFEDEKSAKADGTPVYYKALRDRDRDFYYLIRIDDVIGIETGYRLKKQTINRSSDCFIATACSASSYDLELLYQFRDNYLKKFTLGRVFIKFYYKFSPSIANVIRSQKTLSRLTLWLFIKPIVFTIGLLFSKSTNKCN